MSDGEEGESGGWGNSGYEGMRDVVFRVYSILYVVLYESCCAQIFYIPVLISLLFPVLCMHSLLACCGEKALSFLVRNSSYANLKTILASST